MVLGTLIFILGFIQSSLIHKPSQGKEYTLLTVDVGITGIRVDLIFLGIITVGIGALGLLQARRKDLITTMCYILNTGCFGIILLILGYLMAGFIADTMF